MGVSTGAVAKLARRLDHRCRNIKVIDIEEQVPRPPRRLGCSNLEDVVA